MGRHTPKIPAWIQIGERQKSQHLITEQLLLCCFHREDEINQALAVCKQATDSGNHAIVIGDLNCGPEASKENYDVLVKAEYRDTFLDGNSKRQQSWDPINYLNAIGPHKTCPAQRYKGESRIGVHVFSHTTHTSHTCTRNHTQPYAKYDTNMHMHMNTHTRAHRCDHVFISPSLAAVCDHTKTEAEIVLTEANVPIKGGKKIIRSW